MTDPFDPYYTWLAIPPHEQPPNFYRLLGVRLFEDNPDVIANAADARMGYVRSFQSGPRAALSQKLLNELAAAKVCLLDLAKKAVYDRVLGNQLGATAAAVTPPDVRPFSVAPAPMLPPSPTDFGTPRADAAGGEFSGGADLGASPAVSVNVRHRRASQSRSVALAVVGAVIVTAGGLVAAWIGFGGTSTDTAKVSTPPAGERPTASAPPATPAAPSAPPTSVPSTPKVSLRPVDSNKGNAKAPEKPAAPPPQTTVTTPTVPAPAAAVNQRIAPPDTAAWTNPPRVWRYSIEGRPLAFVQTHYGWRESARDGFLTFDSAADGDGFVELGRTNPPIKVRLFDNRAEISVRGGDYRLLYEGSWANDSYPFAYAARLAGGGRLRLPDVPAVGVKNQPFEIEMWLRPIADLPIGVHPLLSLGATSVVWDVQPDGQHRITARTKGKGSFFIGFPRLLADWSLLLFAYDGQRLYLSLNGQGVSVRDINFLSDAPGPPGLVIGDDGTGAPGLWIDVAGFRVSSRCRVTATAGPNENSVSLRTPVSLPDTWAADADTLALLDFSPPSDTRSGVTDRSGKNRQVEIEEAGWINVGVIPAFVFLDASAPPHVATAKPAPHVDVERPPRNLGDLVGGEKPDAPVRDATTTKRLPVPEAAETAKAQEQVRAIYKTQFESAKKASDKAALATKLGEQARKTSDDPAALFVLCDQARQLFTDAAQLADAYTWIDELSNSFELDAVALKVAAALRVNEVLTGASNAPAPLRMQMVDAAIGASSIALEAERYEEADRLAQLALQQSRSRLVTDLELRRRAKDHADTVAHRKKEWLEAARAEQRLAVDAEDAAANLASGKFRCFRCNQWEVGLPRLVKSGQPKLAEAAELDRLAASDPKEQLKIAAAWERAGEGAPLDDRRDCLERAHHWYATALAAGAKGLDQELAKTRIEAIHTIIPPTHPKTTIVMPDGTNVDVHPGLIGRVFVGGRDVGVLVTYQPGMPIAPGVLQQILAEVKSKGTVHIDLSGYVITTAQRWVGVRLSGGGRMAGQRVFLDGKSVAQVDANRQQGESVVTLPALRHTLSWQLDGIDPASPPSLSVRDLTSNRPETAFYTRQMLDTLRPSLAKKGEYRKEYHLNGGERRAQ